MRRVRELYPDIVPGAAGLLLALILLGGAVAVPQPSSSTSVVGPSAFPYAVSILLGAGSIVLLVRGFIRANSAARRAEPGSESDEAGATPAQSGQPAGKSTTRRFLVISGMLLGYILIFIPIGYLLSTFAFLVAATMYMDRGRWVRNLIFAAVFAAAVYFSFTLTLQVQLPAGILG